LFLRRLERIEVYELKDGIKTLMARTYIDYTESSTHLKQIRNEYFAELLQAVDERKLLKQEAFSQLDDIKKNYKMTIRTEKTNKSSNNNLEQIKQTYLISQYVRFSSSSEKLKTLAIRTATIPICGVAYKLNGEKAQKSSDKELKEIYRDARYFCFLPMPETVELSGLPVYINGSFGLRDDRRDFKWLSNDTQLDDAANWNECMAKEVLNIALIELLNYAKDLVMKADPSMCINEFYYLLPFVENLSLSWKEKRLNEYLSQLGQLDLVFTKKCTWTHIQKVYLLNELEIKLLDYCKRSMIDTKANEILNLKDTIYSCFDEIELAYSNLPIHVIELHEKYSSLIKLKYVNQMIICERFKQNKNANISNVVTMNFLLQQALENEDDEMLNSMPLLPLMNTSWTEFIGKSKATQPIYYIKTNTLEFELFSLTLSHRMFDESKMYPLTRKCLVSTLEERNEHQFYQLVLYNDALHFVKMLQESLDLIDKTNKDGTSKLNDWLRLVWTYLFKYHDQSLAAFESFSLIPIYSTKNQQLSLFSLKNKDPINRKYFMNCNRESTEFPSSLLKFIKEKCLIERSNQLFGCIVLEDLPDGLFNHPRINHYIHYLRLDCLKAIFDTIHENLKDDLTGYLQTHMSTECRADLLELLNSSTTQNFDSSFYTLVRDKLPLFKLFGRDEYITAKECEYMQVPERLATLLATNTQNIYLCNDVKLIDRALIGSKLAQRCELRDYSLSKLFLTSFDYHVLNNNFNDLINLLQFVFSNINNLYEAGVELLEMILAKKIFRSIEDKEWHLLREIYDQNNRQVAAFVSSRFHLHNRLNKEPFYSKLKSKLNFSIDETHLKSFFENLESEINKPSDFSTSITLFEQSVKIIEEYLNDFKNDSASQLKLINVSLRYKWILSKSLTFHRGNELWSPKCAELIGFVKPIVNDERFPVRLHNLFQIQSQVELTDVLQNYKHIIENQLIDYVQLTKIYEYFKQNSNSIEFISTFNTFLKDNFKNNQVAFVYDGVGAFYLPSQLIYDAPISDMLPFFCILNKANPFVKNFTRVYLELFGIANKFELTDIIRLLEQIKERNNTSSTVSQTELFKQNTLIRSIYDLLDKNYLEELSNDLELKKKLLMPIIDDADLKEDNRTYTKFAYLEQCVYLVEQDEEKSFLENSTIQCSLVDSLKACRDKGFELVDDTKVSMKLTKKLGMKSFTELIMNIEGMFVEDFGQNEDLVDRLSKLLDGYKDGLAVFKEPIQNADDANATVVKICYDKRNNFAYRNVFKLLDSGMAQAQGPALLFYNDATFAESDFINLTRLGAGTKRDAPEKIGKFGLGFNVVYNLTDCPSLISADSLVVFDPNVKFLQRRIKNKQQPGIRLKLNRLNSSDLARYGDQFKPYENVFDCNIFEQNFHYNGTLLRLPLRSEPSRLSTHLYNSDKEVRQLLEILYENAHKLLLFTQSVQRIEVHIIEKEEDPSMKLMFEFDKSPMEYICRHDVKLGFDEFKSQLSVLKAAVHSNNEINENNSSKEIAIRSAYIIRNRLKIVLNEFFHQSTIVPNENRECSTYWLIASSFNSEYCIRGDEIFRNFIPCVGLAIEMNCSEAQPNNFFLKFDIDQNRNVYCFLPMSIETGLKYHVNGVFSLSEDRLNFYEITKADKDITKKHQWNMNLIRPLIDNLFFVIESLSSKTNQDLIDILKHFWPLNITKQTFLMSFEESFYDRICEPNSEMSVFPVYSSNANKRFAKYSECFFVDFKFKQEEVQEKAVEITNHLIKIKYAATQEVLINLPEPYLKRMKKKIVIRFWQT
jgi:sacsin